MAYVIAVCGSGGKTTLVKSLAKKYANENKKVCITTTTHMWYDEDVKSSFIIVSNVNTVGVYTNTIGADIIRPIVGAKHCEPFCTGELCEPKYTALNEFLSKNEFECGRIYYIANINRKKELITPLNESDYKKICENFDYVIIEADGSRSMPMKIPRMNDENVAHVVRDNAVGAKHCEPSIPINVSEIIIVVGTEAIGREIGAVCHRFNEFYGNDKYLSDNNIKPETIVSEKLIDDFVGHYYYNPLKEKYSSAKITVYKNCFGVVGLADIAHTDGRDENTNSLIVRKGSRCVAPTNVLSLERVAIVLCASGFSKRFGRNKLMINVANDHAVGAKHCEPIIVNKKLYQLMIDKLLKSKEKLIEKFYEFNKKHLNIDVAVVTQYEEILNDKNYKDKAIMLRNDNASDGLSASIKIGVKHFKDYDAIIFVNADLPYLPNTELANFIFNSILNKNGIAAMYSDDYKNPAYFENKYFDDILKISGDRGPRELFDKYKMEVYKYYISDKYLYDIDSVEDLK